MRTQIIAGNLVLFAPNIGILVEDINAAIDNPAYLMIALTQARDHINNPYLVDACCGGQGPLADAGLLTFEEFLARLEEIGIAAAGKTAKKIAMIARRAEFQSQRHDLVLLLMDAGCAYVCSGPGCDEHSNLAVDHKHPLSRGGTDDLNNLQFLCRSCNSSKGSKTMAEWVVTL